MRFEIKSKKQNLSELVPEEFRNSSSHTVRLIDINELSLAKYFHNYFQKVFDYIDSFLLNQKMNFAQKLNQNTITYMILSKQFDNIEGDNLLPQIKSIIEMLVNVENHAKYKVPVILDILDLQETLSTPNTGIDTFDIYLQNLSEALSLYITKASSNKNLLYFTGQRQLYNIIKDFILHPDTEYPVEHLLYDNVINGKRLIIWLQNPSAHQVKANPAFNLDLPEDIRKANVSSPFYYCISKEEQDNGLIATKFEFLSTDIENYLLDDDDSSFWK